MARRRKAQLAFTQRIVTPADLRMLSRYKMQLENNCKCFASGTITALVSHSQRAGYFVQVRTGNRRPTFGEVEFARRSLVPPGNVMAIIFRTGDVADDDRSINLWQIDRPPVTQAYDVQGRPIGVERSEH